MEKIELPPFSGLATNCEKCGAASNRITYLMTGVCLHNIPDAEGLQMLSTADTRERLHRECNTCGYQWDEQIKKPGDKA